MIKINKANNSGILPSLMKFPMAIAFAKKKRKKAILFIFEICVLEPKIQIVTKPRI